MLPEGKSRLSGLKTLIELSHKPFHVLHDVCTSTNSVNTLYAILYNDLSGRIFRTFVYLQGSLYRQ